MKSIGSVNQVKDHNVKLVKDALKSLESGTKNTVAQMTGLSIATCNTILNELAESGEILEVKGEAPAVGRPPKSYHFNEDFAYVCCLFPSMEGESWRINCAIMNLVGDIIEESSTVYDKISPEEVGEFVGALLEREPKIRTISFGTPGYYYDNRIHSRGAAWLEGYDLVGELKKKFDCDVYIENDVNAMAYGIYYYGKEIIGECNSLVLIAYLKGERIGSGIVINGQVLHGNTGFAGEIGRIRYPDGDVRELVSGGREGMVKAASTAVEGFSAMINPQTIVFTGEEIDEDMLPEIRKEVGQYIPEEHIPKLFYGRDFRKYYIWGLAATALEKSNW